MGRRIAIPVTCLGSQIDEPLATIEIRTRGTPESQRAGQEPRRFARFGSVLLQIAGPPRTACAGNPSPGRQGGGAPTERPGDNARSLSGCRTRRPAIGAAESPQIIDDLPS